MQYSIILLVGIVAVASAQAPTMQGTIVSKGTKSMTAFFVPGMNMNFNLSTPQGILGFLQMENIDPATLVTSNCIANGNPCSPSGGQKCCLSPVFSCQSQGSSNSCLVVPGHVNHLSEIRQIVNTSGVTTQNPIL